MNTQLLRKVFFWISFILLFIQAQTEAYASHAQSADLTYECLGGSQYRVNLSFYRDCAGVAAPTSASINITSVTCGQNLTLTLNPVPGTGIEVSPICASMNTQCTGGSYPGVQEYIYQGIITLPAACTDWVFSFSLCCRNASIGTILTPASENIYVEARLDNLNFPCNNSPVFSNPPIPFVCVDQPYCFNNGSYDADGDSLYYTLIAPATSATTSVTYIAPYSAAQPLASSPPVSFNNMTGDMCMTPTMLQVTVFAIHVEEWRGGELVGTVMRDIQLRTITCTNNNPYANGINNTGTYSLTACAGVPINFFIDTYDVDATQNVSITWNSGIAGGTFVSSGGSRPTGTFTWTPTAADISSAPHCFTITVQDDNCPYNGTQTYSFCITVTGIILNTTTTNANCLAPNGTATVSVVSGTGPYSYAWTGGGTSATQTALAAGTYTVNVTGSGGCTSSATAVVANGAAPATTNMTSANVSCYGGGNGSANAGASGGLGPYTYLWSTGSTAASISSLMPGTYTVTVTTANGCITVDNITITQPVSALSYSMSQSNVTCNGDNNGLATINVSGGTAGYTYVWNTTPIQTTAGATNLGAGTYSVIVNDANGCATFGSIVITEPPVLNSNAMIVSNVTCNGADDGLATVGASGGTGTYSYSWNTTPAQYTQTISGLAPGTYNVTVTDINGCNSIDNITITEPAPLSLSTAAFPVTCYGQSDGQTVVIPAGGTATYSYQWLPTGGTSASATGLSPGTYSITVTDANGCSINASLAVTQPSPLVVSATGNTTICLGQNTLISASASGGTGTYTYNWPGVGTGANQTVSPAIPSVYSVTATDANGCVSNMANVSINVTSLTAANLSVSGATSICFGNSAIISSTVSGNTGTVTVNWSGGLGSGNGPFTVTPAGSTNYIVTVTDACGTAVTASVPVTVNPLPVIALDPQSAVACEQVSLNFMENSGGNSGSTYSWNFGDGTYSNQVNPIHNYTATGVYTVALTITSPFGCVNSGNTTASVTVHAGSVADFVAEGRDGTTMSPSYKFHNNSINSVSYFWTLGDGNTSTLADPEHDYQVKGQYLVSLYTVSSNGCKDSITKLVEIKPEFIIYIPNAFTPDGNGLNDYFTAKGDEISEFRMMIFNRWGDMIFDTQDMDRGWDGTANGGGSKAQDGVYVYKIEVRDFAKKYHGYTGHVTLLNNE